jgi:hypothetical protein
MPNDPQILKVGESSSGRLFVCLLRGSGWVYRADCEASDPLSTALSVARAWSHIASQIREGFTSDPSS